MILGFIYRAVIHFDLIFVFDVRYELNFTFFLPKDNQF